MAGQSKEKGAEVVPLRPRVKCPICGKPSDRTLSPFCSRRCAAIDLNRWLSGRYAIPAVEEDDPKSEEGEGGDDQQ
jgi:endogenous inhibitor of DNA gyrase (YacG/DUF329 family)